MLESKSFSLQIMLCIIYCCCACDSLAHSQKTLRAARAPVRQRWLQGTAVVGAERTPRAFLAVPRSAGVTCAAELLV